MKGSLIIALLLLVATAGVTTAQSDSGDVLLVRSVRVEGNETTKDFVILREMSTVVGDTLNPEKLQFDKDRIYSLGLFNRVDIDYSAQGSDADLVVRVHERWYFYPFPILGIKYGKLANFYYGLGVAHTNFRGRNEKLIFSFALGFDRWIQLIYQTPNLAAHDDIFFRISLSAARVQNLNPGRGLYQQNNQGILLTLGKRFGLYDLIQASGGYEYWRVSDAISGGTLSPGGRDRFYTAGLSYTYDSRDFREYPTEGLFLNLNGTKYGFGKSAVDFFRYGYEADLFIPMGSGVSFGARTHGQISSGGPIPAYRYVYFGYNNRIRGYFTRILEGENLVGGSLELRIPVLSTRYYEFPYSPLPEFSVWRYAIYAALFGDAGKTWFRDEGFGGRHWYSGFGGGIHFLLPYSIVIRAEGAMNPQGHGQLILDVGTSF